MATYTATMVDLPGSASIPGPARALSKDAFAIPDLPTAFELSEIKNGSTTGPSVPATPSGVQTPASPSELEESRPPSPEYGNFMGELQSMTKPSINKYRVLATCLMNFANGLNDSAPGALLPYLEKDYDIGYAVVSLIFVANAIGFLSAAPLTHAVESRLGRARTYAVSECTLLAAYITLVCSPPFAVVVVIFGFIGYGMGTGLAMNNVFCANLSGGTTALGYLHGSYGIGGTIAPLMATALVTHGRSWSTFYFVPLFMALTNLALALYTFRQRESDLSLHYQPVYRTVSSQAGTESKMGLLSQAFRNKTTILGALFIFCYQGAEVSISGWVISFLISYRHSEPGKVGYVTSGFWGGITVGRFLLSHPAHKIGEKKSTFFLVIGAAALQLLVWLVPNVVGEAVAVSFVGLLLGPVYPCATAVFSRLIPLRLQVSSLAGVSALGSSGGAVAPFFTGLLAQNLGTWVLHPICIGLFACMCGAWAALPRLRKRRE